MRLVREKVRAARLVNRQSNVGRTVERRAVAHARNCRRLLPLLLSLLCVGASASARSLDVKITVLSASPARVRVEGRRDAGATVWSFRDAYAGAVGPAGRIENLSLADEGGAAVSFRQGWGEHTAEL